MYFWKFIKISRTSPNWHIWDGGSPSYYTHNWNDNCDHWVWSTQVQSMNWLFQLEEAWSVNPNFWWEVSIWDGNSSNWTPETKCTPEMVKKSKACQYIQDGQTYTPERYLGWVQFGMWLLRPRAVREFRGHGSNRTIFRSSAWPLCVVTRADDAGSCTLTRL